MLKMNHWNQRRRRQGSTLENGLHPDPTLASEGTKIFHPQLQQTFTPSPCTCRDVDFTSHLDVRETSWHLRALLRRLRGIRYLHEFPVRLIVNQTVDEPVPCEVPHLLRLCSREASRFVARQMLQGRTWAGREVTAMHKSRDASPDKSIADKQSEL